MELNDRQWAMIEPLIPAWEPAINGSGRPPPYPERTILEKILWVCRSGARWKDLPRGTGEPSYQTCHRWFQYWNGEGGLSLDGIIIRKITLDLFSLHAC